MTPIPQTAGEASGNEPTGHTPPWDSPEWFRSFFQGELADLLRDEAKRKELNNFTTRYGRSLADLDTPFDHTSFLVFGIVNAVEGLREELIAWADAGVAEYDANHKAK
jgi:hypothetical protein